MFWDLIGFIGFAGAAWASVRYRTDYFGERLVMAKFVTWAAVLGTMVLGVVTLVDVATSL